MDADRPIHKLTSYPTSIWILYFVNAFQSSVFNCLSSYVASSFQSHSLSGVPTALADAFSAAVYLPVRKLMDTWGRAEGFLLMTVCATIGLILMAACNSFPTYCAAYVRLPCHHDADNPRKIVQVLTVAILGFLLHWLRRHGICRGRHHGRCVQVEESRFGVRVHVLAIYHHGVRWAQGRRRVLLPGQLAMGYRLLGNHLPHRGCSFVLFVEVQPSQSPEDWRFGEGKEPTHITPKHLVLGQGV